MSDSKSLPRVGKPGSGRPFKKGADARRNKGGRPKLPAEVRQAALAYSSEAINRLAGLMRQKKAPSVALAACVELLNRAVGRPEVAVTGADGSPLFPEREFDILEVGRRVAFLLAQSMAVIDFTKGENNGKID